MVELSDRRPYFERGSDFLLPFESVLYYSRNHKDACIDVHLKGGDVLCIYEGEDLEFMTAYTQWLKEMY